MPSFFDPGHGPLSSFDEVAVAVAAIVLFTLVGSATEYFRDARGGAVVGALVGFVLLLVLWAPRVFAGEWHYAVVAAAPVVLLVYLYRGRGD